MENHALDRGVLVALRRIIRAVDQHSKKLAEAFGLTGPQLLLLQEISQAGVLATGQLARRAHLAQGTVSEILDRLEERGLVTRKRSPLDHRRVECALTPAGRELVERSPSLLQDRLSGELAKLAPWEQHFILAALERVAAMMHADVIDAAPLLTTGPATATVADMTAFLAETPKTPEPEEP